MPDILALLQRTLLRADRDSPSWYVTGVLCVAHEGKFESEGKMPLKLPPPLDSATAMKLQALQCAPMTDSV